MQTFPQISRKITYTLEHVKHGSDNTSVRHLLLHDHGQVCLHVSYLFYTSHIVLFSITGGNTALSVVFGWSVVIK